MPPKPSVFAFLNQDVWLPMMPMGFQKGMAVEFLEAKTQMVQTTPGGKPEPMDMAIVKVGTDAGAPGTLLCIPAHYLEATRTPASPKNLNPPNRPAKKNTLI